MPPHTLSKARHIAANRLSRRQVIEGIYTNVFASVFTVFGMLIGVPLSIVFALVFAIIRVVCMSVLTPVGALLRATPGWGGRRANHQSSPLFSPRNTHAGWKVNRPYNTSMRW